MLERTAVEVAVDRAEGVRASLSSHIQGLVGSQILQIAADVRRLQAGGREICNLTVGDFDPREFAIPRGLHDGIVRALRDGHTNYPPSNGVPELRRAVAEYCARLWGVRYPAESVLIASGARPAIYASYAAAVDPGDVVIYPVPSWNNDHYVYLSRAKGIALATSSDHHFMPTADDLRPQIGAARLVCINTPLNPTGTVMPAASMQAIAELIVEENRRRERTGARPVFLMADLVYGELLFRGATNAHPVALVPECAPWVIALDGISKCLASTGLRVGWVVAHPAVAERMNALIGHVGAWAPKPEQMAVAEFLADTAALDGFLSAMRSRVLERLEALEDGVVELREAGYPVDCVEPQGAMYLSLHLDWFGRKLDGAPLATNEDIRCAVLDGAGIAMVPFQAFGLAEDTGWFRLSVGAVTVEDIVTMFPRLRALMDRLQA